MFPQPQLQDLDANHDIGQLTLTQPVVDQPFANVNALASSSLHPDVLTQTTHQSDRSTQVCRSIS